MFWMPRTRPAYSREFRDGALDLLRSGRSVADVARSLGCSQQSLRAWRKQAQLDRGERDDGLTSIEREGLGRLRRENARLRQEREILRKAAAFFARESETR
jgi:transposase